MTDRYEIVSQIGEDVLGSVYLADDTMLQRRVMFRHIEYGENPEVESRDDAWRKEFGQYAGKLGTMQHPNMLTIYDISIEDSGAFVVTQFVKGESLAERLEQGPLGQLGVYRMASDMLEAFHAAHESGVFHGALHTESIKRLAQASGGHRHLLVDLGLNQLASMVKAERVKVADPVLMAPELHQEDKEADEKADLFMLGQLCYTALVGGHPYSDKSTEECLEAYKTEGMPPIENYVEGVEPEFSAWVMNLVEYDPDNRPKDAGEAMVALAAITIDEPEPNVPGRTQAVTEQELLNMATPQVVTTSQPVMLHRPATGSVHIAAANSASHMSGTEAVSIMDPAAEILREKKKTKMTIIGGSVLAIILIVALAIGLSNKGDEDETTADGEEEVVDDVHSILIGEATTVNTVAKESTPVLVRIDGEKSLDWIILTGIPSRKNYIDQVDGTYIQNVQLIGAKWEFLMTANPIRFRANGITHFPRASTSKIKGSKPGVGYELQLRIPSEAEESILVNLYIVQKFCDLEIEVSDPTTDDVVVKSIPAVGGEIMDKQRVVKVPVMINNPKPGDFYIVKVISTSAAKNGEFMIGLSGAHIEAQ